MTSHRIPPNRSYLVGQRFGMLTVIDELEHRSSKGSVIYKCRCDCGKITTVNSNHLLSGHTRSCGSGEHRIVDLAGQVFGRLTVINYVERKNHPLGRYDTLEEAIEARKKGEETYFASYRELKKK